WLSPPCSAAYVPNPCASLSPCTTSLLKIMVCFRLSILASTRHLLYHMGDTGHACRHGGKRTAHLD
ncbi:unnamed protein product, partial [Musa banksii]